MTTPIIRLSPAPNTTMTPAQALHSALADAESGMGVVVTGQHCPGKSGSWMIGVANWDPDFADTDFPRWPMRIEAQNYRNGFQPSLVIEAPDGVTVTCLQRSGHDEG